MNTNAALQPEFDTTPPPAPSAPKQLIVIEPDAGWIGLDKFREMWRYRELLYILSIRDVQVKYKQAFFGIAWAVFQPIMGMLTFTLFFGHLAKVPSDGIPYPVFSFLAMLPWTYFTSALVRGGGSLVANGGLLSKVYFPRLFIPSSAVFSGLVDYAISFCILVGLMAYYGFIPTFGWIFTSFLLTGLTVLFALGVSFWLSAINVQYRDVGHVLPFLVQLWMFATPVVYPLSLIPERFQWIARLNPMTGIIEGFRSVLPGRMMDVHSVLISAAVILVVLLSGLHYFHRVEQRFADIV